MMSGKPFFKNRIKGKVEGTKKLVLLLLTFSSAFLLASSVHDYHVSVTQMQYNPAAKAFEVSIRIFTDDLEKGLTIENNNKRIVIRNDDKNDPVVEKYILKSFLITDSSKKPLAIRYIGKEQEEDATWVYLEIPFHGLLSGYKLQNSTLMEVFDDQVNMTNIKLATEKRTFLFKKGQTVHAL